ncbi:hypothetical protein HNV10_17095 [Winogradskyella litoriviva]|uniref:Uncharacterized protein n=2 Tax=Winogradskyella litoriviva TaxID=1220182 RepID=A0ABX2E9X7_9FLAO|nr:hypothetical protein [Winogradskyella litoriviva]
MITIIKKYKAEIIFGIILIVHFSGIIKNIEVYEIGIGAIVVAYGIYEKIKNRNKMRKENILILKTNNEQYRKTSKLVLGIIAIIFSVIGFQYTAFEKPFLTVLIIIGFLLVISSLLTENSSFIEILNKRLRFENDIDLEIRDISSIKLNESEIIFNQTNNKSSRIAFLDNSKESIERMKKYFEKNLNKIEFE